MRFVVTLVIPFFIYCDCVYFALDSYSLRKLTVAFNACVRSFYRRRLFDHISDVSDSILGCSLLTYMEFRLACFIFSLVTGGPLNTWLDLYWLMESSSFQDFRRIVCNIFGELLL
jgi:hypothetical protein